MNTRIGSEALPPCLWAWLFSRTRLSQNCHRSFTSPGVRSAALLDFWNTFAKHDSLFQKSLLLSHLLLRDGLENRRISSTTCSKNARIRTSWAKFQNSSRRQARQALRDKRRVSRLLSRTVQGGQRLPMASWPPRAIAFAGIFPCHVASNRIAKQPTVIMNLCIDDVDWQVHRQNWPPARWLRLEKSAFPATPRTRPLAECVRSADRNRGPRNDTPIGNNRSRQAGENETGGKRTQNNNRYS